MEDAWPCVIICIYLYIGLLLFAKMTTFSLSTVPGLPLEPKTSFFNAYYIVSCCMCSFFAFAERFKQHSRSLALWFQNKPFLFFVFCFFHEFQANLCISHRTSDWVFSVLLHWTPAVPDLTPPRTQYICSTMIIFVCLLNASFCILNWTISDLICAILL